MISVLHKNAKIPPKRVIGKKYDLIKIYCLHRRHSLFDASTSVATNNGETLVLVDIFCIFPVVKNRNIELEHPD